MQGDRYVHSAGFWGSVVERPMVVPCARRGLTDRRSLYPCRMGYGDTTCGGRLVCMQFGAALRQYREHRGWSLADLARASHYSRGYLSNLENGRKRATSELARRCDEVLTAHGELIAAARTDVAAQLDQAPWQTAELVGRLQASDVTPATLDALHGTVTELCCEYGYRDALELRSEAQQWLGHVGGLLRRPVGLHAHSDLLVAAGWLALLTGCVEYDLGMRAAAESTRTAAQHLGTEAEHGEIVGWAHEMTSWFALTQGRYRDAVTAAAVGREAARSTSVHVQLIAQEAKARARMGEAGLQDMLVSGKAMLDAMPYPDRPDHHFKVDPAKWNYYAMDVHRLAGEDDVAERYARAVIEQNVAPDGTELSPMRVSESRLTLAILAARSGDLESAVDLGQRGLEGDRRSVPSMRMVARELESELEQLYPREPMTAAYREALRCG